MGNLIPKLFYTAMGLSILIAGAIMLVGWGVCLDHVARRNVGK